MIVSELRLYSKQMNVFVATIVNHDLLLLLLVMIENGSSVINGTHTFSQ